MFAENAVFESTAKVRKLTLKLPINSRPLGLSLHEVHSSFTKIRSVVLKQLSIHCLISSGKSNYGIVNNLVSPEWFWILILVEKYREYWFCRWR